MILTDGMLDVIGPTGFFGAVISYFTYRRALVLKDQHKKEIVREAVGAGLIDQTIAEPLTTAIALLAAAISQQNKLLQDRADHEKQLNEDTRLHNRFNEWMKTQPHRDDG